MRELCTSDIGVKFFCQNPNKSNGSRSIVYKAHSIEEGNGKYFFFRRDEVVSSFENLFYMMGYGDMMAEIIIDDDTVPVW